MRVMVAVLLASCGPSSAIEVRIPIDPQLGVEHVRLYIGIDDSLNEAPSRFIPDGFTYPAIPPKTTYWRRDSATPDTAPVDGDHVSFVLQPGTSDHLGVVIAIGFKGDMPVAGGALFDLAMESGSTVRYEMDLRAAMPPPPTFQQPPPLMVHAWGPKEDPTACAQLISTTPGDARGSVAVVIEHDIDCDGLLTDEETDTKEIAGCLPDVFNGKVRPQQDNLSCMTQELLPGTAVMAPVLGGNGCVDGRTKVDGNCDASAFCITSSLAAACRDHPNAIGCAAGLEENTGGGVLHIECNMPAEVSALGSYTICQQPLNFVAPDLGAIQVPCDGEYRFVNPGRTGTDDKIRLDQTGGTTGAVTADPPTTGCKLTLHPQGTIGATTTRFTALLEANLATKRGIAIPIVLTPERLAMGITCQATTALRECRLAGEVIGTTVPLVTQCAKSQIVDPW